MKFVLYPLFFVLLFSCSGNPSEQAETAVKEGIIYPDFLKNKLEKLSSLPVDFKIDSLFFMDTARIRKELVIPMEDVEVLSKDLYHEDVSEANRYYLNDYFSIQNAILDGKYETYKEKLDIGMTQKSDAYYVGKIEISDSVALILWELSYSSFEACPYYTGDHILASLIYGGKVIQTLQIAGYETNSDPPMEAENYFISHIDKNGLIIRQNYFNVNEEDKSIEKGAKKELFQSGTKGFLKTNNKPAR